jgi:hypothetical protein
MAFAVAKVATVRQYRDLLAGLPAEDVTLGSRSLLDRLIAEAEQAVSIAELFQHADAPADAETDTCILCGSGRAIIMAVGRLSRANERRVHWKPGTLFSYTLCGDCVERDPDQVALEVEVEILVQETGRLLIQ